MLEAMGGRKFIMALFIMGAGIVIEIKNPNGISVSMVGLLSAIYATFSASNTIITNKQAKTSDGAPEVITVPSTPESGEAPVAPIANEEVSQLRAQLIPIISTIGNELVAIKDGQLAHMQATSTMQQSVSNVQKGISAILSVRS